MVQFKFIFGGVVLLYTMGFSNVSSDSIFERLFVYKIGVIVDVRGKPYSRYVPQSNREYVAGYAKDVGIRYLWAGEHLSGFGTASVLDLSFSEKMAKVLDLQKSNNVVLMCSEADPKKCHRAYKLCAWVHRNSDVNPVHIVKDGAIDSREFENKQRPDWLWFDFGGKRGLE